MSAEVTSSPAGADAWPPDSGVARMLADARRGLDRVEPEELATEQAAGALVVDLRPAEQRARDGDLPGAVVVERNTLEWRLDPTSAHRIEEMDDPQRRVVLVCSEGCGSSLAAASLRALGVHRATDLAGGYLAWRTVTEESPAAPQDEGGDPEDGGRAGVEQRTGSPAVAYPSPLRGRA
ncbi:rhodanese-like domain-containing protein [Phycicoccus sp.]|uniref:rhodanese-like domain-containing protein n=1 Tax=Phycicoccus sp. TaxID=1902410 RepID=UPI002C5CBB56|nr:rhodanese-like domain-containing protein [Phycicoccus sp.]HMM95475.1 rhodanese-like domain-containing protein [Phycicoccus sp.]